MKRNHSKKGFLISQVILVIMLTFSMSAVYGQKYFGRLDDNSNLQIHDYHGPKWDSSTNPYQFLQDLYEEHGLSFHSVIDDCQFSDNYELFQEVAAAFSVPEWALKGVRSIGGILTRALVIQYSGSSSEETDYLKIEYSSNPMDFQYYLYHYPQSDYSDIVKEKLYATRIAQLWELATLIDRESYYEQCLQAYESFSEQYCKELFEDDYEPDCRLHYFRYEGYDHIALCLIAKQAKERLEELRAQAQKHELEWRSACDSNSYSAYEAHHRQYLGSATADSAWIRMQPFEEADYQKALHTNTRVAYEGFFKKFPNGYYTIRAARNIVDLFQAVHHVVPDQMSFVAAYEESRSRYAQVGIANADKNGRTYTLTLCGKVGSHATLRPGETIWLELPAAEDYDALVESDNGEYSFSTLYFNAYGYILYLYDNLPKWGNYSDLDDGIIDLDADSQSVEKLIQEADSICGRKLHRDSE